MVPICLSTLFAVESNTATLGFDFAKNLVKSSTTFTIKASSTVKQIYLSFADELNGEVTVSDGAVALDISQAGGFWLVPLAAPLLAGQSATLTVTFRGSPVSSCECEVSPSLTFNMRGCWLPRFHDAYQRDVVPPISTLAITLPASMTVAAHGISRTATTNGDGTVTTTFTDDGWGGFVMTAGEFKATSCSFGGKPVRVLARPPNDSSGVKWCTASVDALTFHEQRFGTYRFGELDLAEVSDAFLTCDIAAAAAAGVVFLPTSTLAASDWDWQIAFDLSHELAHQWFGYTMRLGDLYSLWLGEGTATYAMLDHVAGLATQDCDKDCQAIFRRYANWEHVYGILGKTDLPLTSAEIGSAPVDVVEALVYFKGAQVTYLMRYLLGENDFAKAIKSFVADPASRQATVPGLLASIQNSTGKDLTRFAEKWIYAAGYPTYSVAVKRSGSGSTEQAEVMVEASVDFVVPVELELVTADGRSARQKLTLAKTGGTLKLGPGPELIQVRFDPDRWLPGRVKGSLAGDIVLDGAVDGIDLIHAAWAVGTDLASPVTGVATGKARPSPTTSVPDWADLVFDGKVDSKDLELVQGSFGKHQ